jgi:hypothetical protein
VRSFTTLEQAVLALKAMQAGETAREQALAHVQNREASIWH